MHRSERHHLKDNELAHLASSARHAVEENRTPIFAAAIGLVVVLLGVGGYYAYKNRIEGRAHALLADATVLESAYVGPPPPPGTPGAGGVSFETPRAKNQAQLTKFKIVADEYPSTEAGLFARYRMGTTYLALGEAKSAAEAFQQVIDANSRSLYGQMARLGLAEAQAQTGAYDEAIKSFNELAQQKDGTVPVDGVLSRLARVYLDAGNAAEATKTWTRLVDEFPDSPFTAEARQKLAELKNSAG